MSSPSRLALAAVVTLVLSSGGAARAQSAAIGLVVDASDAPISSIVHVHEHVPATPGTLDLAYPRWVPGEHGPNGPIAAVPALRVTAGERTVQWTRDLADLNTFHIAVPAGVDAVNVDFDFLGNGGGTYGESRLATSTILAVNWNQFLLYPARADISKVMFAPTIVLPSAQWIAQTALPEPRVSGNRVSYAPATLERLVDSPLDAGTAYKQFVLLDKNGFTNEVDAFADRPSQFALAPKNLDGLKNIVGEMDAIYGARHWRHYHFLLTISDAMPGNGVEHTSSSDDGSDGNALTDPGDFMRTAGLLSHEFNHSWDGKYRRPADLATDNFQVPEQTELLWIYEGMTQFYGNLVPTRAGIVPHDLFRELLASDYASEDRQPGRRVRPLIDTAAAAPFLYLAGRAFGNERRTAGDFYVEGEMLWLDVAARLDAMSHGTKSLDGFCHRFFGIENTAPMVNPYTYAQFVAALDAYAPYDWDGYFKARVYTVTAHPPSGFERLGWRLEYSDVPNKIGVIIAKVAHNIDAADSLGIVGNAKGELSDVLTGSPAARGGLGIGDTIVAIEGREFSADVLDDEVKAAKGRTAPIVMIVKKNALYRTVSIDYHGGNRYPHLVRIPGTPDRLEALAAPHRAKAAADH